MELDRISKHIVVKLAQIEEATAGELKEALGLEQNQSVHYRMDQKLLPQGLVHEHPNRREQPGSRKAARVYQITGRGEEWVDEHGHEVTLSDLDEAEQEIQRLTAEVRELSSHMQKIRRWKQEKTGEEGGVTTQLGKLRDRVDEIEYHTNIHKERDFRGIVTDIDNLEKKTKRLDQQLDEPVATADDLDEVKADIRSLNNRLDSIESQISSVAGAQEEWVDWAESMDDRIQDVEQQGVLGRLKRILFG